MLSHPNPGDPPTARLASYWRQPLFLGSGPGRPHTELLNTTACLRMRDKVLELEDAVFGPDFAWHSECMATWARSGCIFYAAILEVSKATNQIKIPALLSVLLAEAKACEALIRGEILESELRPWAGPSSGAPVVYLASVASERREYIPRIYAGLLADLQAYLRPSQVRCETGLSIASSPAGLVHLTRNGFYPVREEKYLLKYPVLRVDAASARTLFWRQVLGLPGTDVAIPKGPTHE